MNRTAAGRLGVLLILSGMAVCAPVSARQVGTWTLVLEGAARPIPPASVAYPGRLAADSSGLEAYVLGLFHRNGRFLAHIDSVDQPGRRVYATPGPVMPIGRVDLAQVGAGRESDLAADARRRFVRTLEGQPYSDSLVSASMSALLLELERLARPAASVAIRAIGFEDSARVVFLNAEVDAGPLTLLQGVLVQGGRRTRVRTIERLLGVRPSTVLEGFDAEAMRRALLESGLFERVERPVLLPTGDSTAVIQVTVKEAPPGSFDAALGYQSGTSGTSGGLVGTGRLELLSPFGEGRRFSFLLDRLPGQVSRVEVQAHDPAVLGSVFGFEGEFSGLQQDSTYGRQAWSVAGLVELAPRLILTATGSREAVRPGTAGARQVGSRQWVARSDGTFGGIGIRYGAFDDRVNPSRGGHLEVRLERGHLVRWSAVSEESGGDAVGVSTRVRLERLSTSTRWAVPVRGRSLVVVGVDGAVILADSYDRADLLRLGGARSLRGYDEDRYVGRAVGRALVEARYRLDPRSYAYLFAEAGFVDVPPIDGLVEGSEVLPGFGFGAQVDTAAGLVLATYGFNPEDGPTRGRVHLSFSFGL